MISITALMEQWGRSEMVPPPPHPPSPGTSSSPASIPMRGPNDPMVKALEKMKQKQFRGKKK